jgi:hypothetical protein
VGLIVLGILQVFPKGKKTATKISFGKYCCYVASTAVVVAAAQKGLFAESVT